MAVSQDLLSIVADEDSIRRWNVEAPMGTSVVVTFSFPEVLEDYYYEEIPGFEAFSDLHKNWVRQAMDTWSAAGGISFVEVPANIGGQVTFSMRDMTGLVNSVGNQLSGYAYYPGSQGVSSGGAEFEYSSLYHDIGGDVFINASYYSADANSIAPGIRGYSILLHEIGHALGLKHPFEGGPVITSGHDNGFYTVMSYNRSHSTTTLGSVDFEAIKYLYGTTDLKGSWNSKFKAVVHNGSDADEIIVGLKIKDIIHGNKGSDELRGNEGNDRLFGGAGDDTVFGNIGNDFVLAGRKGSDAYYGGSGRDHLSYANADRGVWINLQEETARRSWAANDAFTDFENLSGSDGGNDRLWGSNGKNVLRGLGGDDRIEGGGARDILYGGKGADTLNGERGNDCLTGDIGKDTFVFGRNSGDDTVTDFKDGVDQIEFIRGTVWTVSKLLNRATEVGEDVLFDFANGDSLLVLGATIDMLRDDLELG